ncbi:MAG: ABC transporter permease [Chloroflexi bacterium]|jgi:ribose transport system permease protein|nr:ABC transporter permease [Chloroflexota bacterium]
MRSYVVYVSFLVILVFFSITLQDRGFLTGSNLMNILRQTAMVSVMAVGMTYTICAGEIDLSIGGVVALSALVTAVILKTQPLILAVLAGLSVGAVTGFVNGVITTKVRIPAFLVTLGTSSIVTGLARTITNLEAVPITNRTYNFWFGSGDIGPVSTLFIWTVIIAVIGQIVLKKTPFGMAVLATGGNRSAARYSGVRTDNIRIAVLMLSAISASMAGLLYAGRLHGARYTLGEADLLTVIAAVIIGGTSFTGGKGSVIGAIIGSIVMGMLNNGLLLMGLSVSEQMIARGIIIVLAVSLSLRESLER